MTGDPFEYVGDELACDGVRLADVAERFGTPTYVYSAEGIRQRYRAIDAAYSDVRHRVCYSVKANPNLGVCSLLAGMGAGADVTSGGELYRALHAGFPADRVVFAGVGKTAQEMREALEAGICLFSVESEAELRELSSVASGLGVSAPVALRVNPDVDPRTHPYITTGLARNKFGVPMSDARRLYALGGSLPGIRFDGVGMHIGSQMVSLAPMVEAARSLAGLARELIASGHRLRYFDVGGGYAISYRDEHPDPPSVAAREVSSLVRELGLTLLTEPGRSVVGPAGALLLRVLYRKRNGDHEFAVVDGGMNALLRPALYGAKHRILPVARRDAPTVTLDVVGPVCESADFLARDEPLEDVRAGDLVAVMDAGAYGFAMASEYNGRPRPSEVLVEDGRARLARRRQTYEEMLAPELGLDHG